MNRKTAEFTVTIPVEGEEPLRGKFKINVKLSYREMLNMDAMRRQLLGPLSGEADGMAALIATAVSKIRTHAIDTPSWWKEAGNGIEFDDMNVVLTVLEEVQKVEKSHLEELQKAAEKATEALKAV
jgi:hypothetical protein